MSEHPARGSHSKRSAQGSSSQNSAESSHSQGSAGGPHPQHSAESSHSQSSEKYDVEPIPIEITDEQRTAVLRRMEATEATNESHLFANFLFFLKSEGVKDAPELEVAMNTFKENEELRKLLKALFNKDQGADLFNILKFFPRDKSLTQRAYRIPGDYKQANAGAWIEPYIGDTVKLLMMAIHKMNVIRGDKSYANFVPIVQSSGTGKSRTVDELACQIFTIPLNLRPPNDTTGYPQGDAGLLDFLNASTPATEVHVRYCIFFKHLFDTVKLELEKLENQESQKALARLFRDKLQQPGTKPQPSKPKATQSKRKELYDQILKDAAEETRNAPSDVNLYAEQAIESAKSLIKLIKAKSTNKSRKRSAREAKLVRLVIYFDESHPLTSTKPVNDDEKDYTCYQIMCSVIDRFRSQDLFAIFLSTNSKMTVYSPPKDFFWSARGRGRETEGVQTPFNELPFDQWEHLVLLAENKHTLEEVCLPQFMVRFGRPLFWTRYKHGDGPTRLDIIQFAMMKLAGTENFSTLAVEGQLAVLSARVGLSFNQGRQLARITESRLIEGHMRLAFSIPAHREHVYSGYSSEPILAEAAARLMHSNKMNVGIPAVLRDWCENDLIAKGDRGELVARLLVTKAHDRVIELQEPQAAPPTYTSSILLTKFLVALVGKMAAQAIFDALPDNVADGVKLKESPLGKAKLNFTHWVKAGDNCAVKDEAAWIGLARSLAWQCFDQQEGVDLITPLLLGDEDNDKLGRYNVSAIFWQIKNRNRYQRVKVDAEQLKFFTPYSADDVRAKIINSRPYITIVLNLGAIPSKRSRTKATNPSVQLSKPATRSSPRNLSSSAKHPRYAIVITGCSKEVFPNIIRDEEERDYGAILHSNELVGEHARQGEFRQAILQMKPLWKKGRDKSGSFYQVERDEPSSLSTSTVQRTKRRGVTVKKRRDDGEQTDVDTEDEEEDEGGDERGDEGGGKDEGGAENEDQDGDKEMDSVGGSDGDHGDVDMADSTTGG